MHSNDSKPQNTQERYLFISENLSPIVLPIFHLPNPYLTPQITCVSDFLYFFVDLFNIDTEREKKSYFSIILFVCQPISYYPHCSELFHLTMYYIYI